MTTKKAQHTPGPWTQRGMGIYSDEAASSLDAHIAEVYHSVPTKDTDAANARLIAAAPDLLEAARYALVQVEQDNNERGVPSLARKTENMLRAAIAKATGQEAR